MDASHRLELMDLLRLGPCQIQKTKDVSFWDEFHATRVCEVLILTANRVT